MADDQEELRIFVLSADHERAHRLSNALETQPRLSVCTLTDPSELMDVLRLISDGLLAGREWGVCGLVLDLTTTGNGAGSKARTGEGASANQQSYTQTGMYLCWSITAALAAMSVLSCLPLVVISCDDQLAQLFRRAGSPLVEVVPPSAVGVEWCTLTERMMAVSRPSRPAQRTADELEPSISPLPLQPSANPQVWIDLERCQITTARGTVALTGQEVRVLEVLMRTPGRFHSARELAEHVGPLVDRHCIQQTVSGLRKKLGECARAPNVLVSRRGLGYALTLPRPVRMQRFG